MTLTPDIFTARLDELRMDLCEQGTRVRKLVEKGFDAFFTRDSELAQAAIELDDEVDRVDVETEQKAVALLAHAAREAVPLPEAPLRSLLTLDKINNEFERIADAGVEVARRAMALADDPVQFPPTARVMTNSVVGILRDVTKAYKSRDPAVARLVLQAEDTVNLFKQEIIRNSERRIAAGDLAVDVAFDLVELSSQCTLMAAHATNIAEQIIYDSTGTIVRHTQEGWVDAHTPPPNAPSSGT
ncbi:MAG: PhoU domain-containing protein [Planctomycetota bacterium]